VSEKRTAPAGLIAWLCHDDRPDEVPPPRGLARLFGSGPTFPLDAERTAAFGLPRRRDPIALGPGVSTPGRPNPRRKMHA